MKKVLIAHFRNDVVSGAEFAIADMVRACDQEQWEFYMLVPGPGALADYYYQEGFKVIIKRIETKRRLYPGIHLLHSLFFMPFFKYQRFDLIIANTFPAISRVDLLSKFSKAPLAAYVREYFSFSSVNRRSVKKTKYVFAVSKDVKSYVKQVFPERKIKVVYDHIEIDASKSLTAGQPGKAFKVGFVGRLTAYKQPHLLVKAIPQVLETYPQAKFLLVGGETSKRDQQYIAQLKDSVTQLGVSDNVQLTGHVKNPLQLIADLDIICVPSEREPFPRVILESLYLGTPVIASNTGGCPEMIEDGATGILFDPNHDESHTELAQKIVALLSNEELRTRLASQGRDSVSTRFSKENTVKVFQKFMNQAIYGNW